VGCALSAGITKFTAWCDYCRIRGAGVPDEARFSDRFSLVDLYLARDDSPVKSKEGAALAKGMMVSTETAMDILNAARKAEARGVQVHQGHRHLMRQLGQRYCQSLLHSGGGNIHFRCEANPKKKSKMPMLCADSWDDWFPSAGIFAAAVVDNEVVARWGEVISVSEMEAFCVSRAKARGPVLRTWVLHHSLALISMMPHPGSVPVFYASTRPTVLLSNV